MNPTNQNPSSSHDADGFDSRDWVIVVSDEPGDTTVRPCGPETLKWHTAERERLAKLGFNLDGTPIKPPDTNGSK
jgi:hypothetical protein